MVTEQLVATQCNPNPSCAPNPLDPHQENDEKVVRCFEKPLGKHLSNMSRLRASPLEKAAQNPFDDNCSLYPHFEVLQSVENKTQSGLVCEFTLRVNRHSNGQESPLCHHYVF